MPPESRVVAGMAVLRLLSAAIEVTAALLMLRLARIDAALRINAALGVVGPLILAGVTALGVAGLAHRMSYGKLLVIALGVGLILYGLRK